MTKIVIGSLLEFVPDTEELREARLLNLIEEHMGKDMRAVMEPYMTALDRIEQLEDENYALREQLDDARDTFDGMRETIAELRYGRS